jgi:hypothetical protein
VANIVQFLGGHGEDRGARAGQGRYSEPPAQAPAERRQPEPSSYVEDDDIPF